MILIELWMLLPENRFHFDSRINYNTQVNRAKRARERENESDTQKGLNNKMQFRIDICDVAAVVFV